MPELSSIRCRVSGDNAYAEIAIFPLEQFGEFNVNGTLFRFPLCSANGPANTKTAQETVECLKLAVAKL
jgi:hypothetical protein